MTMRKLIESTHVALGGEIGSPQNWAFLARRQAPGRLISG
jgi:hypothetical protein